MNMPDFPHKSMLSPEEYLVFISFKKISKLINLRKYDSQLKLIDYNTFLYDLQSILTKY